MNETNHPYSLVTCTLIQDLLNVKDGGIYEAVVQLKQQLEAREREVMALTNECVAQKIVIDAVVAVANQSQGISGWHLNGAVAGWEEILPEIYDIETPTTDAALAVVQAQGVEMYAELFKETVNMEREHNQEFHKGAIWYAKQLREGRV